MAVQPSSLVPSSSDQNPNSSNTSPQPNLQSTQQGGPNNDTANVSETKPDLLVASFEDLDAARYSEKYKKYEADYVRRIKAKYFSKKNLYGGNVFENETLIENAAIKSSRWPCTRSFTDPVQSFEDHSRSSTYAAETSTNPSNKKYHCKKSSS